MCKIRDFGHFRIRTPSFNKNYLVLIKKCSRQRMGNRAWTTTERNYWNHFYSQIINPWTEFQGEFGSVNSFPNSRRNYSGILNKQDCWAPMLYLAQVCTNTQAVCKIQKGHCFPGRGALQKGNSFDFVMSWRQRKPVSLCLWVSLLLHVRVKFWCSNCCTR